MSDIDEELYVSALETDEGERFPAAIGYGETLKGSQRELEERLLELGIKEDQDNFIVTSPEDRRKILVYLKGVKSELMGEWMTEGDRYQEWKRRVTQRYEFLRPTYEDYIRL